MSFRFVYTYLMRLYTIFEENYLPKDDTALCFTRKGHTLTHTHTILLTNNKEKYSLPHPQPHKIASNTKKR